MFPVIKACAFHLAFVERETERRDEMQGSANREARATRIAGVPVNLGMHKHYMYGQASVRPRVPIL